MGIIGPVSTIQWLASIQTIAGDNIFLSHFVEVLQKDLDAWT